MKAFAGEDAFASYNAAREYAAQLSEQLRLELLILDGDDLVSAADLVRPLDSMSLFDTGKVVFAKRLFANTKLTKYIDDNLKDLIDKPLVVWHDKKLDARTSLSKTLKAKELLVEFAPLSTNEVAAWLSTEAKQMGVNMPRALGSRLIEYKGEDRGILYQEMRKLADYSLATGRAIDQAVLDSLTGTEATGDIWKFLDALALGHKAIAMTEFDKLTRFTDNTQYLISMLSRELTIMAQVMWAKQHGKSLQTLKLHPFVIEKATKKASRFTWEKLQKLSLALLRLDMGVKQGRVEELVGLTVYLLTW